MTFDDDFLQVQFDGGLRRAFLKKNGLEWPPPETIDLFGFRLERVRFSEITDEQRAGMTHVCRGAEYRISQNTNQHRE